jgi:hypothetical protein
MTMFELLSYAAIWSVALSSTVSKWMVRVEITTGLNVA